MSLPNPPEPAVRLLQRLALFSLAALIVLGLAWELWLAPTGNRTLALKVLPLLLCAAGLLRHRMYTYRWLSLLVWLYFMEGAVRATTTSEGGLSRGLAVAEIALSVLLFLASGFYVRRRQRNAAAAEAAARAAA
jgi:uncharacterized membrane protein